jgi:hypothetical protein
MHQKINTAIEKVRNTFPSVYSKDDVIVLLEQLDSAMGESDEPFDRQELTQQLGSDIVRALMTKKSRNELINLETAEFSIGHGNELILEDVELNESNIEYLVLEVVEKTLREFMER